MLMTGLKQAHASLNRQGLLYVGPAPANQSSITALSSSASWVSAATSAAALQESDAATYLGLMEKHWTVFKRNSTGKGGKEKGGYKQNSCFTHCGWASQTIITPSTTGKDHSYPEHPSHKRQAASLFHSSVPKLRETNGKRYTVNLHIIMQSPKKGACAATQTHQQPTPSSF